MVRVISQETYDEVVKENMEEFDMSAPDAIADAVKQFEAQGVDLTNIIKDLAMTTSTDIHVITASIRKLENYLKLNTTNVFGIMCELDIIKKECDKDIAHRVHAGREGAYNVILNLIPAYKGDTELVKQCYRTMIALMTTQPDILTPTGINLMMANLSTEEDAEAIRLILRWIKECCIKHEKNRQSIFKARILQYVKNILLRHPDPAVLRDACAVLRALVLDDDVRVEFGKAHEHARIISSEFLCIILDLMRKYKHEELFLSDILFTLSSIIVRNEFCKKVDDAGGIELLLKTFDAYTESEKINRQGFKLLKVLSGNDDCKAHIIQKGGAKTIVTSLKNHKENSQTVTYAFNTIAALTLRSPENSTALFNAGVHKIIVECMKTHPNDMNVQKSASWAIRNMVSRSRHQNTKFLSLGIEEILQENLIKFKNDCEYDIKAALRDLGCKVEFKEEWTGKGGKLTTEENK